MVGKGNGRHSNIGRAKKEAYEKEIGANPALSPRASPATIVALFLPHSTSHAGDPAISKLVDKDLSPFLFPEAWVPRIKPSAQRHFARHVSVLEVIWYKGREPELSSSAKGQKKSSGIVNP